MDGGGDAVTPQASQSWLRRGAVGGVGLVIAAYGSVLYDVADVVGDATLLAAAVAGALLLGTLVARALRPRTALALTAGLLLAGLFAYFGAVPESQLAHVTLGKLLGDSTAMLTGLSVLRLLAAGTWALTVAPGPTFLAWYLAVRRRYAAAVGVAGATLSLLVLTGDAGEVVTLIGVVGGAIAVGLGNVERAASERREGGPAADREPETTGSRAAVNADDSSFPDSGTWAQLESLTAIVAAMILLSTSIGLAAGGGNPVTFDGGGVGGETTANLVSADDRMRVAGSLRLSPKVRLLVESDDRSYWRTATYDRYTGDGWVRTREAVPYSGRLDEPPGETERIRQTVVPRTELGAMPAANAPIAVQGPVAQRTLVTPQGGLRPADSLAVDENYTVVSERPVASPEDLRAAGDDYPAELDGTYRQLPSSTPERVSRKTEEVAGDEDTAYDKAVAIERYLESNKEYSLQVDRPSGDVADAFLFEMEAGYCVYFATTMAAMLRTQDVPARMVTGYGPGQAVATDGDDTTYVVRGQDAHAWVEVYFPDVGWVRFDPTPAEPRRDVRQERLRSARSNDVPDVDARGSANGGPTPTPTSDESTLTDSATTTPAVGGNDGTLPSGTDDGPLPRLPSDRTVGLGLIALVGAVAASRRSGLIRAGRRTIALYYQRRRDPESDVERAWQRVEGYLGRRYRERRPGETPRAYLDALAAEGGLDPRAREVAAFYERTRYGDGISRVEATGAVQRADTLTRRTLPLIGRRYRRRGRR